MRYDALLILTCLGLCACQSPPASKPRAAAVTHSTTTDSPNPDKPAAREARAAALVDGRTLTWSELRPLLVEASGGTVLGEWVLDRRVEAELRKRKLAVSEADVQTEKTLLRGQLADDPDEAVRLLDRLRESRGLGPHRFDALLRRNAGLRKLIAADVKVTEPMVRSLYEQRYGELVICRMILVEKLADATLVTKRLAAGEPFIDLAVELSTDSSAVQGGLLPPISPADVTFPKEIRDTATKLKAGELSPPIALENGFAILRCERRIKQESAPFEEVADRLRELARLQVERTLMNRQARTLMQDLDVTVLDADLDRAWKQQRDELLEP